MAKVPRGDTKPELIVRRLLHALGLRFRLHGSDLPGRPDIVMPRWKTVVFVHGCFWHRHARCRRTTTPEDNFEFWQAKFQANRKRDRRTAASLRKLGWKVVVVWECETLRLPVVQGRILSALGLS
jgi:DNA mismatch endonuclease (patch repair protein)